MFNFGFDKSSISGKRGEKKEFLSSEDSATHESNKTTNTRASIVSTIFTILVVLAIVIPVRIYIGKPFLVNGSSMDPAFASWDYLLIDVFTYKFLHEPERGDVIVFTAPVANNKYFIKRVIGLPGETVELKNGKVIIYNDEHKEGFALNEPYVAEYNASHRNMSLTLSNDEYFVMGDNRAGSYDSRFWGPLKRDAIVGRAFLRLFPFNEISFFPAFFKFQN